MKKEDKERIDQVQQAMSRNLREKVVQIIVHNAPEIKIENAEIIADDIVDGKFDWAVER